MKRIAFLGAALALMGAGCSSSFSSTPTPAPVVPSTPPAVEQPMQPTVVPPTENPVVPPATTTVVTPPVTPPVVPVVPPKVPEESVYVTVEMSENGFKPAQLSIKKDTIVRFKNVGGTSMWPAANPHPTHTSYQDFDARRMVKPGETYEFKFKNAGTWGCHDHVSPGLTCRIVVTE